MIDNILVEELDSPGDLVDTCLDEMGVISVSDETREVLKKFANQSEGSELGASERVAILLRLTAATHDFQRA